MRREKGKGEGNDRASDDTVFMSHIFSDLVLWMQFSGGGGLVALPAYLFTGLPVHNAYACNKVGCLVGNFTSFVRFLKNGLIDGKTAIGVGVVTFFCSACGAQLVLHLPDRPLKIMILASMPAVALLIFMSRKYPPGQPHRGDKRLENEFAPACSRG